MQPWRVNIDQACIYGSELPPNFVRPKATIAGLVVGSLEYLDQRGGTNNPNKNLAFLASKKRQIHAVVMQATPSSNGRKPNLTEPKNTRVQWAR